MVGCLPPVRKVVSWNPWPGLTKVIKSGILRRFAKHSAKQEVQTTCSSLSCSGSALQGATNWRKKQWIFLKIKCFQWLFSYYPYIFFISTHSPNIFFVLEINNDFKRHPTKSDNFIIYEYQKLPREAFKTVT